MRGPSASVTTIGSPSGRQPVATTARASVSAGSTMATAPSLKASSSRIMWLFPGLETADARPPTRVSSGATPAAKVAASKVNGSAIRATA